MAKRRARIEARVSKLKRKQASTQEGEAAVALPPTASHVRKLQKRVRFLDRVKTSALAAKAAVFKRKRKTQGISLGALVRSPFARGFGARDGTSVLTFFCVCQEDALPQLESFLSTASRAKAAPQFLPRASAVVHKGARIKRFAAETVRTCVRPSPCASAKLRWLVACRCTCADTSRRRRASLQFCPTARFRTTPLPL
jgi:hypothetical protein